MRVIQNDPQRLVLSGVPGRAVWMVAIAVFGVAMMAASAWFGLVTVVETQSYLPLLPLSVGFLIGAAFTAIGVATLAVGRQTLTLDRTEGVGRYEVRSPVIEVGKPCRFDLDQIDGLAIENRSEARGGGDGFDVRVADLRLRIRKPRRVISLDVTHNGRVDRLRKLAAEVSAWLAEEPGFEKSGE